MGGGKLANQHWVLRKRDKFETIREWKLDRAEWSDEKMERLLQRLVCSSLSEEEIIAGSDREGRDVQDTFLYVNRDLKNGAAQLMIGSNPYFIASLEDD